MTFPHTKISAPGLKSDGSRNWIRRNDYFEVIDNNGSYRSAGVGGAITGMGFSLGIIDDPFKSNEDADSPVMRQKVWDWYTSTFLTRAEKGARILLTMTRWHEDDLAGRLLQLQASDPEADQWDVVCFPAMREDNKDPVDPRHHGQSLWPKKYPDQKLRQIRASVGERQWNSLYQQRPSAMEGNLIKRSWLKYYKQRPSFEETCIVADLTFKKGEFSDYAVVEAWGRVGSNVFLIDQIRARMNFPEQLSAIIEMKNRFSQSAIYIEEAANGAAVIQTLRDQIMGIIPVKPRTSKEARLQAVAHVFEAENVHYPDPSLFPWVDVNLEELATFPNATNDDTVDTATMAISQLSRAGSLEQRIAALSKL